MSKNMRYRSYEGSVEVSFDDGVLHGKVLHIRDLISYEADTVSEIERSFRCAVDQYLQDCEDDGSEPEIPYKGTLNIRMPAQTHRQLAEWALRENISLNALIVSTLTNACVNRSATIVSRKVSQTTSSVSKVSASTADGFSGDNVHFVEQWA